MLCDCGRLPEGQAFLKEERWQLKKRLEQREASGDVMAALGSIEECLGNLEEAVQYLKCSLEIEPHSVYFAVLCLLVHLLSCFFCSTVEELLGMVLSVFILFYLFFGGWGGGGAGRQGVGGGGSVGGGGGVVNYT